MRQAASLASPAQHGISLAPPLLRRYAYAACCVRPTNVYNALCKVDTRTGDVRWARLGTWERRRAACAPAASMRARCLAGAQRTRQGCARSPLRCFALGPPIQTCACLRESDGPPFTLASCGPLPHPTPTPFQPGRTWHEPGGATWEPFFAPRPGGRDEDDGVVLSTVMQPDGRSALLVLDARTWQEVARAVLPYALPSGFHGCFVPS